MTTSNKNPSFNQEEQQKVAEAVANADSESEDGQQDAAADAEGVESTPQVDEPSEESAAESGQEAGAEEKEEKEDSDTKYLRLAADFQNYKRRAEKEKADIYVFANEKIALDIIEVMDNFERALKHSDECVDKQFAEGIDMIYKQLKSVLDKNNVVEIEAEGKDFDPNFHNAVMAEENPDFESGKVIQVLQKGYTLNDRVIRPSMVRVAQ